MSRILSTIALPIIAALVAGAPARRVVVQPNANAVIALERSALDRWAKGDVGGFLDIYANEITYFDPTLTRRADGLPAMRALLQPFAGKFRIDRYEMLNPRVQGSDDVAVLSYNLQNYARQPDGTERSMSAWNVTSVYRRTNGQWRTIHAHFSFTKPMLAKPPSL
ncbi:MAG TPA: nuclear transport factor 2 family protein [Gemmatimonadaceae bacterium]|nr:nuclear transport factor 2 family protein [Gemmatimonadaceae bacterium]